MEFHRLREIIDKGGINDEIEALLTLKRQSNESAMIRRVSVLNNYIEQNLRNSEDIVRSLPARHPDPEALDIFFRTLIAQP